MNIEQQEQAKTKKKGKNKDAVKYGNQGRSFNNHQHSRNIDSNKSQQKIRKKSGLSVGIKIREATKETNVGEAK